MNVLLLLYRSIFLSIISSLIVDSTSNRTLTCCQYLENSANLLGCVNNSINLRKGNEYNQIAFAVFISKEITEYSAHSSLVMALYTDYKGYNYRLLSPETGDDFDPKDRRWNKVKSIIKAFHPTKGWARNYEALVFIDADLVVLDFSLDIKEYLDNYPNSNLIASADALDIANTGFLIVRNTVWTREFFAEWWLKKDSQFTFCDQHVFNVLYNIPKFKNHIQILKQDELNSIWPALETFNKSQKVLHLMGELMPFRIATFNHSSHSICSTMMSNNHSLIFDNQLGFTREKLLSLAKYSINNERSKWIQESSQQQEIFNEKSFELMHEATANLCDDRRSYISSNRSECKELFREIYEINKNSFLSNLRSSNISIIQHIDENLSMPNRKHLNERKVFHLNQMTKIRFDLLYFSSPAERESDITLFQQDLYLLSESLDMSDVNNQKYIRHKKGILFSALASFSLKEKEYGIAINHAYAALDEIGAILTGMFDSDPDFSGFVLEYIEIVSTLTEAFQVNIGCSYITFIKSFVQSVS